MSDKPAIVVFGATGYTGGLVAETLLRRGIRPILAARSPEKLDRMSQRLGGLEVRTADVNRPDTVRALVGRGDVLISTVGPFHRWGGPALDAAVSQGAHYIDSCGEGPFIRKVLEDYHDAARAAECALLPAFGYDYVPGNLAGALAVRDAGAAVRSLDIAYFATGSLHRGLSSGTRATIAAGLHEPTFVLRGGTVTTERTARSVRRFRVGNRQRQAFSVSGSEIFLLHDHLPTIRDITVYNGWFPSMSRGIQAAAAGLAAAAALPVGKRILDARAARQAGSAGGPDAKERAATRSYVVAVARDQHGNLLAQTHLEGPSIYDLTAELIAWGAERAAAGQVRGAGALGPIQAFGLDALRDGCQSIGLHRIEPGAGGARSRNRTSHTFQTRTLAPRTRTSRGESLMSIDRVAITGGARGIGRATAEACLRAGISVAIGDVDGPACAAVATELGDRAIGLPLDVRDPDRFEAFLAEAEERLGGPLDALINNAGVAPIGLYIDEDPRDTQRLLDINIGGVLTGTRLALRRFLPRGHGHIVNLASSAGQIATAGGASYAATKHAVVGFTRAIRAETRGTGVRTTIVMPGLIRTDMIAGFEKPRGTRIVGPEAVADAIVDALRSGRQEVFVPRELGPIARLITGTPPDVADRLKKLLNADSVMAHADMGARAAYKQRIDTEVKESAP